MDIRIIDGMKKEGKPFRNIMLFGYIFAILMPLSIYLMNNDKYSDKDIILFAIAGVMFGTIGLYGWLYSIKYRLEFDNEKVYLKTLFRKIELNIGDIEKYACNRYRKSVFYQFNLFIKDKKVLINTRYKDEFEKVLKDNKIEQIIK
ncbi:MAG: hypothetical protein KH328_09465 [Staphylococcus sp.]|jgi:hypothetical protein|nr:hypothetical protein [Staphylococcus sp.]